MTFALPEDTAPPPHRSSAEKAVPWSWRDLAAGIGGVLVLLFLLGIAAYPLVDHYGEDSTGGRLTQAVVNGVWYVLAVAFVYLIVSRRGAGWRALGFRSPQGDDRPWRSLLRAIVLFLLAGYAAVMVYGLLVSLLGLDFLEPDQQLPDDTYDSDVVVIATGVLVVLGAPLVEETLFRGFLFAKLRMHLPFLLAAALSGSLFSLAHADPGLILPFTVVGVLLAYVYERTGTLWGSIGVHFCFNLITFLILVFVPDAR
jgi:membrane protease YdiL (CAAX protease family)